VATDSPRHHPTAGQPLPGVRGTATRRRAANEASEMVTIYSQMFQGDWIHTPTTTNHSSVIGMKIFQPKRMIWS
jgi:hypothetical protein